jgi:hypothetical protein
MQKFMWEFWDLVDEYQALVDAGKIADDRSLVALFKQQKGQLNKPLLKEVARWKTGGRTIPLVEGNSDEDIALANKALHDNALTIDEIIDELCKLRGVRLPTASVILAFSEPDKYSVIDYRVCEFLCNICGVEIEGRSLNPQDKNHWGRYQLECSKLLEKINKILEEKATLRDLDRAMWIYHKRYPEEFRSVGFSFENIFNRFAYSYVAEIETGNAPDIPFSDDEKELFCKGVKEGLIEELGHKFNFRESDKGPYNIFTVNREYITHAAAYIKLIKEFGFEETQCKIEYKNMDIAVFIRDRLHAYVEVKAGENKADKLIEGILNVARDLSENEQVTRSEALTKADIIKQNRPDYFVVYTPHRMQTFKVVWKGEGFELIAAEFPAALPKTE